MCKHVAAVLYGVGARLDQEPELLFKLRHVDHLDLISKASQKAPTKRSGKAKVIEGQDLSNLFGIEIDSESSNPGGKAPSKRKRTATKVKAQRKRRLQN
jgi:uncharacterized Zn finger protein